MTDAKRHESPLDPPKLRFALLVTSAPGQSQGALSAYRFARALIAEGHQLSAVFFFEDGVFNGSSQFRLPADRFDPVAAWRSLSDCSGTQLLLCSRSAQQRGIVDVDERARGGEYPSSLAPGFIVSGLATFMETIGQLDRVMVFGG
jgi:tRNA 2-thiouridine synthesizing protein D